MTTLDTSQQHAVDIATTSRMSVITGGPGTGKTTTLKAILAALSLPERDIALASPTGKAAKRMTDATGISASTIHRLLRYIPGSGFEHDGDNRLPHRLIVVDEASMLDVELAAALLSAIPDGARVILIGDANQLPSVGPGNVLADIIASGRIPVAELTHIHRQSERSYIPVNAARVLAGDSMVFDDADDMTFVPADTLDDVKTAVIDAYKANHDVTVLTPQRNTAAGVDALNDAMQDLNVNVGSAITAYGRRWAVGDKVMQTKNDYDLDIMNGETGCIVAINGSALYCVFGGRTITVQGSHIKGLRLAYASTIHKSQGSEYDDVVIVCHSGHSYMLTRRLLYTAITRGKRHVTIIGDAKGVRRAIRNNKDAKRWTGLAGKMKLP